MLKRLNFGIIDLRLFLSSESLDDSSFNKLIGKKMIKL